MDNRNLITALVIAALITLTVTAAGCATNTSPSPPPGTVTTIGNNTTFSSGAGFNITYPKTLTIDQNSSATVKVYIYQSPNAKIDGVNVGTYALSPGQQLSDFINFNLNAFNNYSNSGFYKNFTILNQTNLTFAGQPAHQIVFQAIIPQQISSTTTTNTSVRVMQYWVINNNTGYVVQYKAIPSDYDTYLAQAQEIMNSFVLT
jgi:hypothetical protein